MLNHGWRRAGFWWQAQLPTHEGIVTLLAEQHKTSQSHGQTSVAGFQRCPAGSPCGKTTVLGHKREEATVKRAVCSDTFRLLLKDGNRSCRW